jgi:F-type H+-transporting ATPase subunit epsilon
VANALTLDILTPTGPVAQAYGVQTVEVRVPGSQGALGILADHVPFMTLVVPGIVSFTANGKDVRLAVRNGFLEVDTSGRLTIMLDRVVKPEDVAVETLRARLAQLKVEFDASSKAGSEDRPEHRALANEFAWIEAQLALAA